MNVVEHLYLLKLLQPFLVYANVRVLSSKGVDFALVFELELQGLLVAVQPTCLAHRDLVILKSHCLVKSDFGRHDPRSDVVVALPKLQNVLELAEDFFDELRFLSEVFLVVLAKVANYELVEVCLELLVVGQQNNLVLIRRFLNLSKDVVGVLSRLLQLDVAVDPVIVYNARNFLEHDVVKLGLLKRDQLSAHLAFNPVGPDILEVVHVHLGVYHSLELLKH